MEAGVVVCAWKSHQKATSQGMQAGKGVRKGKEMDSLLELPRGMPLYQYFHFSSMTLISDFFSPEP